MASIELQGLTKRFGPLTAVDDLNLMFRPGTVTGFLGVNGAGKTTTLRMLLGLVTPTAGAATFDGRRYAELDEPARHVGAVLEASSFHPGRRAVDHLRVLATAGGLPAEQAGQALERVGLAAAARRRVGGFSLGMRQRLALAAALLGEPAVLVLDEPANGLDPEGVQWLRTFLRAEAEEGRTVIVSSHLLAEVSQTVDHVVIIDKGRLVADAPLGELTAEATETVVVTSPEAATLLTVLGGIGVDAQLTGQDEVTASTTPDVVGKAIALNGIVVHGMQARRSNLEDVFFNLTSTERSRS
ncbi:MAG TPA: ATP-binding cassette domain-containing protein [Acidimicrobiales bacterium]|nr:ATP-binding cassette domain-containing protein [Acidimicrobiales bacterium]